MTPNQIIITAALVLLLLVVGVSGLILSAPTMAEDVRRLRERREEEE